MKSLFNYIGLSIVVFGLAVSVAVSAFAADSSTRTNLGGGYTCDTAAKIIYKGNGNKTVKLSKAKDALSLKISSLGSSKKDKAKKAAFRAAKKLLKPCTDGTLSIPSATPTPGTGKNPDVDRYCEVHPKSPKCR